MESLSSDARNLRSGRVLLAIGLLWIVLGFALFAYILNRNPSVEVTWETATEQGTAGFNLYRSLDREGDYALVNEEDFIESRGSSQVGASYRYIDEDVETNTTYYYLLEEIEVDGSRQRYDDDIFEYLVPGDPIWLTWLAGGCFVLGVILIFIGWREIKHL